MEFLQHMRRERGCASYVIGSRSAEAGGMAGWRQAGFPVGTLRQITPEALAGELRSEPAPLVFDLRSGDAWEGSHVPGARSLPFEELDARLAELERGQPVTFVCAAGFKSSVASSKALALGYNIRNVTGGMAAWNRARLPVEEVPGAAVPAASGRA